MSHRHTKKQNKSSTARIHKTVGKMGSVIYLKDVNVTAYFLAREELSCL